MTVVGCGRQLQVLVLAKAPRAGQVKTRLCPPCTPQAAAAVAEAALADTLDAVASCSAESKVLALDGSAGPWLPSGIDVIPQRGDDLGERIANAWADTRSRTGGWGLQLGMDTPQVTAAELDSLLRRLRTIGSRRDKGALLGPAFDGGWWIIGLAGADPNEVFADVPMSTPCTAQVQAGRLRSLGLRVLVASARRDIDTIEDLEAVVPAIPRSRTAAVARNLLDLSPLLSGIEVA